jgi:hypothetical protein
LPWAAGGNTINGQAPIKHARLSLPCPWRPMKQEENAQEEELGR